MSHLASLAETLRERGRYHDASELEILRFKIRHSLSKRQRQRLIDGAKDRARRHIHRVAR